MGKQLLHRSELGGSEEMNDLINKSSISDLLRNEMGPFAPTAGCQVAVTPPIPGLYSTDQLKGPWPEHGNPGLHMDGLWTGAIPQSQSELDLQTGKPIDPKWLGDESASVLGSNTVPLWEDPAKTLSIGSFTTFVFVAINDQTVPGRCAFMCTALACQTSRGLNDAAAAMHRGQTNVLAGGHHVAQEYFRAQYAAGGPVGAEGPGWPRLVPSGEDGV